MYSAIGFTQESVAVGYSYTNYKQRFSRTQFQKHKLVADGADATQTEWEIMRSRGYDRVWDCGQTTWVFSPH